MASKKTKKGKRNYDYDEELERLQIELVKLQGWVIEKGLRLAIVFEGRDAAGKGGAIKRIAGCLNPRVCRIAALPKPSDRERRQWYFQRYVAHLPAEGEIVLFDRSWYNRAGVEKVLGFCTDAQYEDFMTSAPAFERQLVRDGMILLKYWFQVEDQEQEDRFRERLGNPLKRWKFSNIDVKGRSHFIDYARARDAMLARTDIPEAPWYVVDSNDKKSARLNVISHILSQVAYEDLPQEEITLPPVQKDKTYKRPPKKAWRHIPTPF